jgi:hypothetical protein
MRAAARKYRLVASGLKDQEAVNFFATVAADHDLKADMLEARQPREGSPAWLIGLTGARSGRS